MIIQGDVFREIQRIPDGTFDCIITSPPYWRMRAYFGDMQHEDEFGKEWDFNDYLDKLMIVMSECKRVLKDTGTCWVNMGDPYCGSGQGAGTHPNGCKESYTTEKRIRINEPFAAKCRVGLPERFYIRCIDAGWIARNHIAWFKPNAKPNSAKDRFTINWELVFFFSKRGKYYFDLDPVRQKSQEVTKPFNIRVRDSKDGISQMTLTGGASRDEELRHNKKGEPVSHKNTTLDRPGAPDTMHANRKYTTETMSRRVSHGYDVNTGEPLNHPKGKNPGAIFVIPTKPYTGKHQATFPVALPEYILQCACPPDGIVFDPFFGAGSTGVAAERQGRRWCGIELNPESVQEARERLEKYRNEKIQAEET